MRINNSTRPSSSLPISPAESASTVSADTLSASQRSAMQQNDQIGPPEDSDLNLRVRLRGPSHGLKLRAEKSTKTLP